MNKEKLLILDGNSLMNRAFYALPPLTNQEGLHTNAILGFTNMLFKMKEELKPDYIVTTFDRKSPTFRHEEYKDYKAGRKRMPEELAEQFPVVKELLGLLAIDIFEIDGFEADDIIGTLSVYAEQKGIEVFIITGDKDALQLATDNVKVVITKKGISEKEIYDRKRMEEEFLVTPKEFIDVKGLMGDASDNIPGVPGIGEKTAFKLIQEYKSIENVLSNIDKISGKKIKENLMEYSEQAIFSKKLATIILDVPIEIHLDSIKSKDSFDEEGLRKLFYKLQFKALLDRLPKREEIEEVEEDFEFQIINNIKDLERIFKDLKGTVFVNFDIDTDINRIYFCQEDKNYIIESKDLWNTEEGTAIFRSFFQNEEIQKVSHNIKQVYTYLFKKGISLKGVRFDTSIAAYLIDSSKGHYLLENLIQQYLQKDIKGEGESLRLKQTAKLEALFFILEKKLEDSEMIDLMYQVEMPLVEVLASMECLGFKINSEALNELGIKFNSEITKIQAEIYTLAGEEFNINSPKQLGKILFEKLDLPPVKKTKTGYSTNAEVLETLSDKHPIIDKITYYRQLTKLHSTYVEGLKAVIAEDGKIHSSFNQTVTSTGRLSSTEPNLQNIPIKYELGREIRRVFIPDNDESILLSADYSQIELRVLAHIAGDHNLIEAFKNNIDIHTKTASEVFRVPLDMVTSSMRSNAKAVNFGIVYGISDFSLAKDLKISKKEAKTYIDIYFERYPNVKRYLEDIVKMAKEKEYVTTILNRRRYVPEIKGPNKILIAFGERLAMNAPIQGSAADIIKIAMINVYKKLKEKKLKSTLILQVHDELILNVYKDELEVVSEIVKKEMENAMELSLPLVADVNFGKTWYEAK